MKACPELVEGGAGGTGEAPELIFPLLFKEGVGEIFTTEGMDMRVDLVQVPTRAS